MMTLLVLLLSLGTFVFTPARQVLDRQDHHTLRTHWFRKLRAFAPTEAAVREDQEEVGNKEECDDGQHIKSVDGYRSLRRGSLPRFDYLESEVSRRIDTWNLDQIVPGQYKRGK